MQSANCWYFKENLHTIHLDVDVRDSFNSLGTGSVRCLGECWTMYECTTSNVCIIFLYAAFAPPLSRCRPVMAIPGKGVRYQWGQFGMRASPYALPNIDMPRSCSVRIQVLPSLTLSLFRTTVQCYQPQTKISDISFWMTFIYIVFISQLFLNFSKSV